MSKQARERIDFCGESYLTDRYPLEQCADVKDVLAKYRNQNTSCRRGYVGHWRIDNDMLHICDALTAINPGPGISLLAPLRRVLPPPQDGRLVAVWYSGEMELRAEKPCPDPIDDSTCVRYRVLIEAGRVIRIKQFSAPDRPPEFPDVSYEELPRFLKQQSE